MKNAFNFSHFAKFMFLAFTLTLLTQSCTKENLAPTATEKAQEECFTRTFGFPEFNEGQMHNDLVSLIIRDYSICATSTEEKIEEMVRILRENSQSITEAYGMEYEEFKQTVNQATFDFAYSGVIEGNYPITEYFSNHPGISPGLNNKLSGLTELITGLSDNATVDDIKQQICDYYTNNVGALRSRSDIELFGSMADVLKHSAELWLPTANGGNNAYYDFQASVNAICNGIDGSESGVDFRGPTWWKVLTADAGGVIAGATSAVIASGGLAAVPNPALGGIPTAGAVGVVEGAIASGIAAL